jgi:Spy/CpxP family protein refolding chaperone
MDDLRDHHPHHPGGIATFVARSLDSLNTTPAQTHAIAAIRIAMDVELLPTQDAERAVLLVLAEGAAAGDIDREKVDAAIGKVTTAAAGSHAAVTESLSQLHAILTPAQRAGLVDKIDAAFVAWRGVKSADASADAHGSRLGTLTQELVLSSDQVAQIRANLQAWRGQEIVRFDRAATEDYLDVFDEVFAADVFDAKTLDTGDAANVNMAAWGVARMASFYEAVVPTLTPNQRIRLADLLRRHATEESNP